MPSLCIYGDSNLGAIKVAQDQGLINGLPEDMEFFGAPGPDFRRLRLRGGRIVSDNRLKESLKLVNPAGRTEFGPKDFEGVIFYTGRVRFFDFARDYGRAVAGPNGFMSSHALRATMQDWLWSRRMFRMAATFAEAGTPVVVVPSFGPTQGIMSAEKLESWSSNPPSEDDMDMLRGVMTDVAAGYGVPIVHQPTETLVDSIFTRPEHATARAAEIMDDGHKSPAFSAMMVEFAMDGLRAQGWQGGENRAEG